MNLVADMKNLHAKKFKEGTIKQATFLKSFKKEILELAYLGYKPSEIKDFLEDKLDVTIHMNAFYAWLNYTKGETSERQHEDIEEVTSTLTDSRPSKRNTTQPVNTLDVLSSTDFD